jgi:hypothetical protein
MKEFKLINENRGNEIIQELEDELNSKFNDMFAIPAEAEDEGCSNIHELEQRLTDEFERNYENLSNCHTQSHQQLNECLNYDYLLPEEVIFCFLGLDIRHIPENFSTEKMYSGVDCQVIDNVVGNTIEFEMLKRAVKIKEKTGITISSNGEIYTEGLVKWATSKFIEEVADDKSADITTPTKKIKIPGARTYPEDFAKELHRQLIKHGLISGEFSKMWTWIPDTNNSLAYLCKELSSKFKKTLPKGGKFINVISYITKPQKSELHKAPVLNKGKGQHDIDSALSDLEKNYTK